MYLRQALVSLMRRSWSKPTDVFEVAKRAIAGGCEIHDHLSALRVSASSRYQTCLDPPMVAMYVTKLDVTMRSACTNCLVIKRLFYPPLFFLFYGPYSLINSAKVTAGCNFNMIRSKLTTDTSIIQSSEPSAPSLERTKNRQATKSMDNPDHAQNIPISAGPRSSSEGKPSVGGVGGIVTFCQAQFCGAIR